MELTLRPKPPILFVFSAKPRLKCFMSPITQSYFKYCKTCSQSSQDSNPPITKHQLSFHTFSQVIRDLLSTLKSSQPSSSLSICSTISSSEEQADAEPKSFLANKPLLCKLCQEIRPPSSCTRISDTPSERKHYFSKHTNEFRLS